MNYVPYHKEIVNKHNVNYVNEDFDDLDIDTEDEIDDDELAKELSVEYKRSLAGITFRVNNAHTKELIVLPLDILCDTNKNNLVPVTSTSICSVKDYEFMKAHNFSLVPPQGQHLRDYVTYGYYDIVEEKMIYFGVLTDWGGIMAYNKMMHVNMNCTEFMPIVNGEILDVDEYVDKEYNLHDKMGGQTNILFTPIYVLSPEYWNKYSFEDIIQYYLDPDSYDDEEDGGIGVNASTGPFLKANIIMDTDQNMFLPNGFDSNIRFSAEPYAYFTIADDYADGIHSHHTSRNYGKQLYVESVDSEGNYLAVQKINWVNVNGQLAYDDSKSPIREIIKYCDLAIDGNDNNSRYAVVKTIQGNEYNYPTTEIIALDAGLNVYGKFAQYNIHSHFRPMYFSNMPNENKWYRSNRTAFVWQPGTSAFPDIENKEFFIFKNNEISQSLTKRPSVPMIGMILKDSNILSSPYYKKKYEDNDYRYNGATNATNSLTSSNKISKDKNNFSLYTYIFIDPTNDLCYFTNIISGGWSSQLWVAGFEECTWTLKNGEAVMPCTVCRLSEYEDCLFALMHRIEQFNMELFNMELSQEADKMEADNAVDNTDIKDIDESYRVNEDFDDLDDEDDYESDDSVQNDITDAYEKTIAEKIDKNFLYKILAIDTIRTSAAPLYSFFSYDKSSGVTTASMDEIEINLDIRKNTLFIVLSMKIDMMKDYMLVTEEAQTKDSRSILGDTISVINFPLAFGVNISTAIIKILNTIKEANAERGQAFFEELTKNAIFNTEYNHGVITVTLDVYEQLISMALHHMYDLDLNVKILFNCILNDDLVTNTYSVSYFNRFGYRNESISGKRKYDKQIYAINIVGIPGIYTRSTLNKLNMNIDEEDLRAIEPDLQDEDFLDDMKVQVVSPVLSQNIKDALKYLLSSITINCSNCVGGSNINKDLSLVVTPSVNYSPGKHSMENPIAIIGKTYDEISPLAELPVLLTRDVFFMDIISRNKNSIETIYDIIKL